MSPSFLRKIDGGGWAMTIFFSAEDLEEKKNIPKRAHVEMEDGNYSLPPAINQRIAFEASNAENLSSKETVRLPMMYGNSFELKPHTKKLKTSWLSYFQ